MEEKNKTKEKVSVNDKENQAKKIVQEDKDKIINLDEIQRIVMLYTGREANESEISRFENIKESELKILTDYLDMQRETIKNEEKIISDNAKVKGDLANKEMKTMGQNKLDMMKSGMPTPPMPIAENGQMPISEQSMMAGRTEVPQKKTIQDGENFLVKFT